MPLPLIALDLPSMGEPQAIAPPAVVSTEWVDRSVPSPAGLASGVEKTQPESLPMEAIQLEGPPSETSQAEIVQLETRSSERLVVPDSWEQLNEATVASGTADYDTPSPSGEAVEYQTLPEDGSWIRILADRQAMDVQRQVVTATGDVLVQFGRDQIAAEQIWVNLNNRYLRAEGEVFLNRNQQVVEGDTATYNLLQGTGNLTQARGSLQISTLAEDFSTTFPNDSATDAIDPFNYRLLGQGSISQVTSPGGVSFSLNAAAAMFGAERSRAGRLRFEADQLSFDATGWYGENLRLTNDPFSPPELELRGNRVSFVPKSETEDELCIENPRLVFDHGLSLPLVRPCYQFQNGQLPADFLNPLLVNLGYDSRDRDGFFIDREFPVVEVGTFQIAVAPQFYLSR